MILISENQNINIKEIEEILTKNGITFKNTDTDKKVYFEEISELNKENIKENNKELLIPKLKIVALLAEEAGYKEDIINGHFERGEPEDHESRYEVFVYIENEVQYILEESSENYEVLMEEFLRKNSYMINCDYLGNADEVKISTKKPITTKTYKI